MRNISESEPGDLPPVVLDRRRSPDRRTMWRGGRRDADWIKRPPDALARFASRSTWLMLWRDWLPWVRVQQ